MTNILTASVAVIIVVSEEEQSGTASIFYVSGFLDHWHGQSISFGQVQAHSHQLTEGGDSQVRSTSFLGGAETWPPESF